jgi:hypothetical protein
MQMPAVLPHSKHMPGFQKEYFFVCYWDLNSRLTPLTNPSAFFCDGFFFFDIQSRELFAWAGFKPQSS